MSAGMGEKLAFECRFVIAEGGGISIKCVATDT